MADIEIYQGLPASGKTTEALARVKEKPNSIKRINKDDLRAMIDGGNYTKDSERIILEMQGAMIKVALKEGKHVIIDDTNLNPFHIKRIKGIVSAFNVENNTKHRVKVNTSFLAVPLETCIERDLKRPNSVGKDVIMKMHKDYLAGAQTKIADQDKSLPHVWLCDVDGTVALIDHSLNNPRSPYDMTRVKEDLPNVPVVRVIANLISSGDDVIFISARNEVSRKDTIDWIIDHIYYLVYDNINDQINRTAVLKSIKLFMRADGDNRKDSIVKKEIYEQHIKDKFYVMGVFDDRKQVVDMWRNKLGLTVFQVQEGDF